MEAASLWPGSLSVNCAATRATAPRLEGDVFDGCASATSMSLGSYLGGSKVLESILRALEVGRFSFHVLV